MKKTITILAILLVGILIGKFALSNTKNASENNHKTEKKIAHWTCSMHPEIDLLEFGPCPKCGMDLIPKEDNADGLDPNEFKLSKNAMALANIETMVVGNPNKSDDKNNESKLSLSGKIKANEKATSVQTAHFGGRLESLKYRSVGEYVKKGSLIASVYSPELVTAQNEFVEALNIKNEQPELYKAVRNKLKNWKISEQQILEIEQTKKVITNFSMYANVSGYIDEIMVQEGNHVNEGTPLFKVSNLGSVWAVFDVYENDIKNIKRGQKITIKANAYPDKEIKARISYIDPNLNAATRTIPVRATIINKGNRLKPGMLLLGEITLKKAANTTLSSVVEIPKSAVLWTGKRSVVYVKTNPDEPIFELREVTLGNAIGTNYQVIKGLENNDEVVVNGTFTVDAAAQLQGKRSMMNKKKQETREKKKDEKLDVNPKFKKQLDVVFQDYINLKDAFVLTDAKKVNETAKQMVKNLKKVKITLLKKPKAHEIWMPNAKIIKADLQRLVSESDIEKQRATFISLSNAMTNVIASFGTNKEVYVQHCPMANDNKGADWLSFDKAIKNPYFGDKMLSCGSVEQIIK